MLRIYRLPDGGGLYLEVHPNGGKFWRFRYRYDGKQNSVSCGVFPAVPIEEARTLRDAFSAMLANGINPAHTSKPNGQCKLFPSHQPVSPWIAMARFPSARPAVGFP
ncbi:MAG: Arm DNA-binding domain-containing protein [Pseudomonadota bacterium]|nr:Arm DNA-binding domain-containing protein [Pseudomonadota bacterium]MDP1903919.1 Arm DNA-binding domain-containing protein [Pseudomonadota bacterium]MDP2351158.1 Arm DNA-binding domain-containing protein [Pseudomonadota bacterium]